MSTVPILAMGPEESFPLSLAKLKDSPAGDMADQPQYDTPVVEVSLL